MTAAYVRVSSKGQDLGMQRAAIERCAAARGEAISKWYEEKKSARTIDRPVLAQVRADARAGKVRKVYIYRLDRVVRSGIRDAFEVVEELHRHGCVLVTVSDAFSFDGPLAEPMLALMAWAAKMERIAINERIAAAREGVEARGGAWGRPVTYTAADAVRVEALSAAGGTVRGIATETGLSRSVVGRIVSRKHAAPRDSAPVETPAP